MKYILRLSHIKYTNYSFEYINISYSIFYREIMINNHASIEYRIDTINDTL